MNIEEPPKAFSLAPGPEHFLLSPPVSPVNGEENTANTSGNADSCRAGAQDSLVAEGAAQDTTAVVLAATHESAAEVACCDEVMRDEAAADKPLPSTAELALAVPESCSAEAKAADRDASRRLRRANRFGAVEDIPARSRSPAARRWKGEDISREIARLGRYPERRPKGLFVDSQRGMLLSELVELWGAPRGLGRAEIMNAVREHTWHEDGSIRFATPVDAEGRVFLRVMPKRQREDGRVSQRRAMAMVRAAPGGPATAVPGNIGCATFVGTIYQREAPRRALTNKPATSGGEEATLRARREELLRQKQEAIHSENFEEAARARDALRSVDAKLQQLASAAAQAPLMITDHPADAMVTDSAVVPVGTADTAPLPDFIAVGTVSEAQKKFNEGMEAWCRQQAGDAMVTEPPAAAAPGETASTALDTSTAAAARQCQATQRSAEEVAREEAARAEAARAEAARAEAARKEEERRLARAKRFGLIASDVEASATNGSKQLPTPWCGSKSGFDSVMGDSAAMAVTDAYSLPQEPVVLLVEDA